MQRNDIVNRYHQLINAIWSVNTFTEKFDTHHDHEICFILNAGDMAGSICLTLPEVVHTN